MKIAVLGVKAMPSRAEAIDQHCEALYPRLVGRGHHVTVFLHGRQAPARGFYQGVELKAAPASGTRGLGSLLQSASGSLAALQGGFDLIHYHAAGPALFSFMPHLRGQTIVATVHGLEWQLAAGGKGGRALLKAGEWATARFPRRTIVLSRQLQGYFQQKYGRQTEHIPNGVARAVRPRSRKLVKDLGIEPGRYILFLGDLVPEKGCHDLITAHQESGLAERLVIACPTGGFAGGDAYAARVRRQSAASGRVMVAGDVEGELLHQLSAHAALFVLPSLLDGQPLELLRALALGIPVLAADIEPVRETLEEGKFGALYRAGDLTDLRDRLGRALRELPELKKRAAAGRRQVRRAHDWDRIAERTEQVYQAALSGA